MVSCDCTKIIFPEMKRRQKLSLDTVAQYKRLVRPLLCLLRPDCKIQDNNKIELGLTETITAVAAIWQYNLGARSKTVVIALLVDGGRLELGIQAQCIATIVYCSVPYGSIFLKRSI